MRLSLISLNVERSKHLDLVIPFLKERKPDVFCVQELSERDMPQFADLFPYHSPYFPSSVYESYQEAPNMHGLCVFSAFPLTQTDVKYYVGDASTVPPKTVLGDSSSNKKGNRAVLFASIEKEGTVFRIGTTHFTWSEGGAATDTQREHLQKLLAVLETENEFVLCGDFNMPRGGELFSVLAERYTDNIPAHYKTSIDVHLHREGEKDPKGLASKMVDGLFTTPGYAAHDVELVSGVSDHMAVVASVEKS